ncbi:MAG: hypothetical protein JXN65_03890 [Clostridia bacterium]|nr:hypothetical protein [Clostridia bacterium]
MEFYSEHPDEALVILTAGHSRQDVPLYVMGNGSENFEDCEHISQIPTIICEMLDWEPLPEVLPKDID